MCFNQNIWKNRLVDPSPNDFRSAGLTKALHRGHVLSLSNLPSHNHIPSTSTFTLKDNCNMHKHLTTLKRSLRKTCVCSEEELVCASSPGRWHTGPPPHSPAHIRKPPLCSSGLES